jgi:hypothetical protein
MPKPKTYKIRGDNHTRIRNEEVMGTPIVIEGFEELSLFVTKQGYNKRFFSIYEERSGLPLVTVRDTLKDAIRDAKAALEKKGLQWVLCSVENAETRETEELEKLAKFHRQLDLSA